MLHSGSYSTSTSVTSLAVEVIKKTLTGGGGDTIIEDSILNEVIAAMMENMKDFEAEIASLKERNEILRNYVASLEETIETMRGCTGRICT